jgi:hypothetical protein
MLAAMQIAVTVAMLLVTVLAVALVCRLTAMTRHLEKMLSETRKAAGEGQSGREAPGKGDG